MIKVGDGGFSARSNNFDLLRLGAAMAVLVGHAYAAHGLAGPVAPVAHGYYGGFGVIIFFSISGFLVTRSFVEEPHIFRYGRKRALRIFPALIVAVTATAFLLGPFVTTLSVTDYFTSHDTYGYLARNWFAYPLQDHLPGVFGNVPLVGEVNSSLWTLRYEMLCYVIVAACGTARLINRRTGWLLIIPILMLRDDGFSAYVVAVFAVGALYYIYRDYIPLHPLIFIAAVVFGQIWNDNHAPETANLIVLPYCTMFLALWRPLGRTLLTRYGDVSYGVYVYAFPITQAAQQALGNSVSPLPLILIITFFTYVCAQLSWHYIEKPALRLKHGRRVKRAEPVPTW